MHSEYRISTITRSLRILLSVVVPAGRAVGKMSHQ